MKNFALCLFFFSVISLNAWQIDSTYTIVVPEKAYDPSVSKFLAEGAEALQKSLADRDVNLPIVHKAMPVAGQKSIFIGFPDEKTYEYFAGSIRISERDIYITGNDCHAKNRPGPRNNSRAYYLGSIKALTRFMEEFLNARFVLPGKNGIAVLPGQLPELPEKYEEMIRPALRFATGRNTEMLYDYANNAYGRGSIHSYGGHSWYDAVPREKYAQSHPEYFAVLDGRRAPDAKYYSLCFSNPAVSELIYQEMLKQLDAGAETVELAQTDGYRQCECPECEKLYAVEDPAEKLWIFHRGLAERLLKERPQKKVMIIAYSPTFDPPKTFTEFPANTMIELTRYDAEDFAKWKEVTVPCGLITYVYNWGYYQINGLTPKFSSKMAAEQVRLFLDNQVQGVYRCGFGELFGLEGAVYYIYGKLFDDPSQDPEKIRLEYCQASFGLAAAPAMDNFFRLLDERIDQCPTSFFQNQTQRISDPATLLTAMWTPKILKRLDTLLSQAEHYVDSPARKRRLELVRYQFEYLHNLMKIQFFYNAYTLTPSYELLANLLQLLDERNQIYASSYDENGRGKSFTDYPAVPLFGIPKADFIQNGRMYGSLAAPNTWNVKAIREKKVLPGVSGKSMTVPFFGSKPDMAFVSGVWKDIPWETLSEIQLNPTRTKSRFKLAYDHESLYIAVESSLPGHRQYLPLGADGKCWQFDCVEVIIDPWGTREKYFHFITNPVENSTYEAAVGLIDDPLHPLFRGTDVSWNGSWFRQSEREGDLWRLLITIPFSSLGKKPASGDLWTFNLCREAFPEISSSAPEPELSCWSPCFEALSFHEKSTFGELKFR
jgi:hypothetical protein